MRRSLRATALGLLVVAAAPRAAPATPGRSVWATGQLTAVDTGGRTIEIRQGDRELPFTIAAAAEIVRNSESVPFADLKDDVGQRVRLRYTPTAVARLADRVEVLGAGDRARH